MSFSFILPTLVGVVLVATMGLFDWKLRPRVAIPLLTGAMAAAAAAVLLVIGSNASAFVLGPARATAVTSWCRSIPLHHEVGPLLGFTAVALTALFVVRCARVVIPRRRAIRAAKTSGRISVLESEQPFAYAVPTKQGCVVVSTGLLAPLAADEKRAVVARAIATTALGPTPLSATLPALGGGSVTRRVEALIWPDREPVASRFGASAAFGFSAAATIALSVQMHHFSTLLDHLCRGVS